MEEEYKINHTHGISLGTDRQEVYVPECCWSLLGRCLVLFFVAGSSVTKPSTLVRAGELPAAHAFAQEEPYLLLFFAPPPPPQQHGGPCSPRVVSTVPTHSATSCGTQSFLCGFSSAQAASPSLPWAFWSPLLVPCSIAIPGEALPGTGFL